MKKAVWLLICFASSIAALPAAAAERMKPFVLAYTTTDSVDAATAAVRERLTGNGFEIAGSYSPYPNATVVAVTSPALRAAAAKTEFGGYAAAQRVAITKAGEEVQVSYTNPTYMSHAYRLESELADVSTALEKALGKKQEFGPAEGLTAAELRKYHYMFGMEYFDDPLDLGRHKDGYEAAVAAVEANLASGAGGVSKVYRIDIPGKQETVFGVAMKSDDQKYIDESFIMGHIDFKPLRSTAHLPYEILVSGDRVYTLSARFRIAINFPDLSMMGDNSFMKIMQTPDAVKAALLKTSGGQVEKAKTYAWE